jgi:hypothetical protein
MQKINNNNRQHPYKSTHKLRIYRTAYSTSAGRHNKVHNPRASRTPGSSQGAESSSLSIAPSVGLGLGLELGETGKELEIN